MGTADVIIVGTGAAGLFHALKLPPELNILIITKDEAENSDSFLAQGGMCVMRGEEDYDKYFEDTMHAGHYENNKDAVDVMIRTSPHIVDELVDYGVDFRRNPDGSFAYTREGAHSEYRILFHDDLTGREITSKLLERAMERDNITVMEYTTMVDILCDETENRVGGVVVRNSDGTYEVIRSRCVVLATGGMGGLFRFSTNFPHITGDALAIALRHGIEVEHIDYIQIHPTSLYSERPGRRFLISESVRGEGALLYNAAGERFVNELLPRDVVARKILEQMHKDGRPYVELDIRHLGKDGIRRRFPNIYKRCLEEGYDMATQRIPVTPAQHYFMGGIKVDLDSKTTMDGLYAVGETSCNGVHGRNRLASNSLLESLVFAERAADHIREHIPASIPFGDRTFEVKPEQYEHIEDVYRKTVLEEIKRKDKEFYEEWFESES